MREIRYSIRSLALSPGLASALLLTIALGIGATASVQGFVRGLVSPDLPIEDIGTVASVFAWDAQRQLGPVPIEEFLPLTDAHDAFEWLGAARESQANIVLGDRASVMSVAAITLDIARLLQLDLSNGVVVSRRLWRNEFGATADDLGAPIRIDGVDTNVTGVAPEWLEGVYAGHLVDVWTLLREDDLHRTDRERGSLWPLGRLRPGVSIQRAQAMLNAKSPKADVIAVTPYSGMTPDVAAGMSRMATLLRTAAATVFLIACANVTALTLSRATARARATTVRVALGASPRDIARLVMSDSVAITAAGGAVGAVLAVWTMQLIPVLLFEQDAAHLRFAPNLASVAAVSAVCAVITIACGLLPLAELRRLAPAAVLQRESAGPSPTMRRLRAGLVIAQMTLCFLLVISSALLLDGFRSALRTSAGDRLGQPILATVQARLGFDRSDIGLEYFRQAERAALSVPGITTAAWVSAVPGSMPAWQSLRIEPAPLPAHDVVIDVAAFPAVASERLTLRLLSGRMFAGGDAAQSCGVAIVNDVAARELFESDPLGRVVEGPGGRRAEIVGVVSRKPDKPDAPSRATIFYAPDQSDSLFEHLGPKIFRTAVRPALPTAVLDANVVSPDYFDAIGWPRIAGSTFPIDSPAACRVAMINQEAADRYFAGNAVGAAVLDGAARRTEIIGVVRSTALRSSQRHAEPAIYYPMAQDFRPRLTLILGAARADAATLALVRRRLDGVAGGAAPAVVTTLDAQLSRTALAAERIATVLVAVLAATAVALGVVGLYGAMADAARQRRREVAVRVALGAQRWRVIGQVMADGGRLAAAGAIAGLLGSFVVARWLTRSVATAGSLTLWAWLAALLVLTAAVVLASIAPARRSLLLNPFNATRDNG